MAGVVGMVGVQDLMFVLTPGCTFPSKGFIGLGLRDGILDTRFSKISTMLCVLDNRARRIHGWLEASSNGCFGECTNIVALNDTVLRRLYKST